MNKIEIEISDYDLRKALITSSMLVVNREDADKKRKYTELARDSINKLHQLFYENHELFSDIDFLVIKRLLNKLDVYDFSEEFSAKIEADDYLQKRFRTLNYTDITENDIA